MTKKGIVFIIIIFSVVSILVIAVWGTLPENTSQVSIESLEIVDFDDYDEDGEKIIEINKLVTPTNPTYLLKYKYSPNEAYGDIKVSVSESLVSYQHLSVEKEIYLFYSLSLIEQEKTVTVTIKDERTGKSDTITLWFSIPDIIVIPD